MRMLSFIFSARETDTSPSRSLPTIDTLSRRKFPRFIAMTFRVRIHFCFGRRENTLGTNRVSEALEAWVPANSSHRLVLSSVFTHGTGRRLSLTISSIISIVSPSMASETLKCAV